MRSFLYWAIQHKWLLLAFLAGGLLLLPSPPEGLTEPGREALVIALVAMILFITEPIPLPAIALLIAVFQVLFRIATPTEVAQTFMNDSVFFILGSLMLAVVIVKQRLDRRLAVAIFRVTGPKVSRIMLGLIIVSAGLASIIGEHTVAAIMMPVAMSLIRHASDDPKKCPQLSALLLFSIAYACAISGLGTPSGGARNAIMIEYWSRLYQIKVSYFDWIKYAYPMVVIQAPILALILLRSFSPEKSDLSTAIRKLRAQVLWEGKMHSRDWLTVAIFGMTLLMWVFASGTIGLGTPALMGVSLYLIAGLVDWEDLNAGVNWGVFLIYASTISLGVAIEDTGAAAWVARLFMEGISALGIHSGVALLSAVAILAVAVASFISRAPALGILTPIVLNVALDTGTSVLAMGFVTAMASAFTYMTVIGSTPNTIIFSSGYLQPRAYLRAGVWMTLASLILLLALSQTYWRLVLPI
jgi:solute carrier family 13 (sodium-dependent dicarboxylate transporter), member 2/3/5